MRRRRPAAAGPALRRPAAVHADRGVPRVDPVDTCERFERGEVVKVEDIPLSLLTSGLWLRCEKADHEGSQVDVAGRVQRVEVDGVSWEVILQPSGTKSEDLLRFCTSAEKPVLRCHLCRVDCDRKRSNPNLLHLRTVQKIATGSPVTWETNCEVVDELAGLRQAQEQWAGKDKKEEAAEKVGSSSSSQGKNKKKKKAKKKEKKKQLKERRKKLGGKANALKTTEALFSGTGLDPCAENRKLLLRKVKSRMKKEKGTSSSSSSTMSSEGDSEMEANMLEERSKIQRLAEVAPGVLACEGLRAMKDHVLTANGTPWGADRKALPAVVLQYVRQHCVPQASAPMAREFLTLAAVADCLLQARPAEAIDIVFQRVKALEQMAAGQHWMLAQKLEIIPGPDPGVASRAELQVAQRERRLDEKTRSPAAPGEKSKGKAQGKGRDRDRDKGKGKAKGGNKEDSKK